jgi:predicted Na+-dependent transporter
MTEHRQAIRRLAAVLNNRYAILGLALLLGMLLPGVAQHLRELVTPTIILVIMLSTLRIPTDTFLPLRNAIRPLLVGTALSYLLLGSAVLGLGRWAAPSESIWVGFVFLALAPPGFAVIPFTHLLRGDVRSGVLGSVGGYLAVLGVAPLLTALLIGGRMIDPVRLLIVLGQLIVAPLLLSRLLRRIGAAEPLEPWIGKTIDWGFFTVLFIVVGLNRDAFLRDPPLVLRIGAVAVTCTFILGFAMRAILRRVGVGSDRRTSFALLATIKNSGWATATALALYDQEASIPGAVWSVVTVLYLLVLSFHHERRAPRDQLDPTG